MLRILIVFEVLCHGWMSYLADNVSSLILLKQYLCSLSCDPKHCLDWTAEDNASLANELFQDHMLKHWYFSFPALQCFDMIWRINHPHMNDLMVEEIVELH